MTEMMEEILHLNNLRKGGYNIDVSFGIKHSTDTYSLHFGQFRACINYQPVHKETSLMKTEGCTGLWG